MPWRGNGFAIINLKVKGPQKLKLLIFVTAEQFLMSLMQLKRSWLGQSLWEDWSHSTEPVLCPAEADS